MAHRTGNSGRASAQRGLDARLAAAALLGKVVDEHAILEALTHEETGLARWRALPEQDRALARAIATVALRHRGLITAAFDRLFDRPPPQKARHLLHSLHVAAAQILFMAVPESAAVNLGVAAIAQEGRTARFSGLANAVLRRMARETETLKALPVDPKLAFSPWLGKQLARDHGRERAASIAGAIGFEPVLDLSPHPRLSPEERSTLLGELGGRELPTGSWRLVEHGPVATLPGYGEGAWWVQDAAAALPVGLLGAVDGLRVADLCAAPGGKTMQLAAAGARVTAVDISAGRLERLRENLARVSLEAEIVQADIAEWQPDELFDAAILDAPCTATGTMRRHPDIAWNRSQDNLDSLVALQRKLIMAAARLVRPGGTIVYANCSILKAEGEDQLAWVNREDVGLRHVLLSDLGFDASKLWMNGQGALRTLPFHLPADPPREGGMDGFFACRFQVVERVPAT